MKKEEKQRGLVWIFARQMLLSYLITGILLLILSFILYRWDLSAGKLQIGIYIVYGLVNLINGWILGKCCRTRRFVWGALGGVLYFVILFLVSLIINHGIVIEFTGILWSFLICVLGGMAGGMVS